jgi:hypothetical protein
MTVYIHFTGFWSGFHERTNPVHEGFFLDLFQRVYSCEVKVGSFAESTVLVENTQISHPLRTAKKWMHTYLYSAESYLRTDANAYTCVLYGQRNHGHFVNIPLYIAYIACSHNLSFIESNTSTSITEVPPKGVLTVVSNPSGSFRNSFLETLERRGISVTYAGHYKNNIGKPFEPQYNTQEFRDYVKQFKFIISMENSEEDTYITEKITHGLLAGSIPVYWGSKQVSTYFNRGRFLEVTDRDAAIEQIVSMTDQDWLRMVNQQPFTEFGRHYTIGQIAKHIRNVVMPKPFPLLDQVYIICNPEFEPSRYERCRALCTSLGLTDDHVTYICPTYKHTITPEMMQKYVIIDLVKRLRALGTKRGDVSLILNYRATMESIIKQYREGTFLILESDVFTLPAIGDMNRCLEHLQNKRWDAINIGSGLDSGSDPLKRLAYLEGKTPYRDVPNSALFLANSAEDLSNEGDINRYIRKFMTRCTDAQLWSYEGCHTFYNHLLADLNYAAPIDYYLTQKTEIDMNFKYYWSTVPYFDQRSNRGMEPSSYQGDLY